MTARESVAVVILFKAGYPIAELAELFSRPPFAIEQELRLAMHNDVQSVAVAALVREVRTNELAPKVRQPKRASHNVSHNVGGKTCAKHPDCTEFDKRGNCRQCQRDYQKAHWLKTKAANNAAKQQSTANRPDPDDEDAESTLHQTAEIKDLRQPNAESTPHSEMGSAFRSIANRKPKPAPTNGSGVYVYSKPVSCPKCGNPNSRLRRSATAVLERDYWICLAGNCQLRISHYNIKVDTKYEGAANA